MENSVTTGCLNKQRVRHISIKLFVLLFFTYGYFVQPIENAQVMTRLGLTLSLIEDKALTIDKFERYTKDKSPLNGHYYPDKPPGLSLLALPAVVVAREAIILTGHDPASIADSGPTTAFRIYAYVATVSTVGLLTALAAVFVLRVALALGVSLEGALFGALAFGLGTPAFGWATAFFGHAAAGALLFFAFSLIVLLMTSRAGFPSFLRWQVMIGALLGLAVSVEIIAAVAGSAIGLFALAQAAKRGHWQGAVAAAALLVLGGVVGLAPLLIYDTFAFGSPLNTGYANVVGFPGMNVGFFGISTPDIGVAEALLFGNYRGLLPLAPILFLVPVGWWLMAAKTSLRGVVVVSLAVTFGYLAIGSGYYYWDGGAATGPRYLIPVLPFAGLALAFVWQIERLKLACCVLLVVSSLFSLICTSVDMFSSRAIASPFLDHLLPAFLNGNIHSIAGLAGLGGLPGLIPLVLIWVLTGRASSLVGRSR